MKRPLFAVLVTLALGAFSAFAAEQGAPHAAEHHAPSIVSLLFPVINFALFLLVLPRVAWPIVAKIIGTSAGSLREYLRERREQVIAALVAAEQTKAEAAALRAELEARMKRLDQDAARARDELVALAETEARRVLDAAQRLAERIRSDARLVADQEIARAKRLLQQESAELVAELAGGLIARRVTPTDQSRFVQDFLAEMQRSAGGSSKGDRQTGGSR